VRRCTAGSSAEEPARPAKRLFDLERGGRGLMVVS
jgi:hypothetical protein